jgi:hypothetical protein
LFPPVLCCPHWNSRLTRLRSSHLRLINPLWTTRVIISLSMQTTTNRFRFRDSCD